MTVVILSINAGSSSLKTTLYTRVENGRDLKAIAKAEISNINQPPAQLKYASAGRSQSKKDIDTINDHQSAFEHVLDTFLNDKNVTDVQSKDDINYACHRVVQGGNFKDDQLITKETFHKIEALEDLAPLYAT